MSLSKVAKVGMSLLFVSMTQMGFAQARPPLQNIQLAQQKVSWISNHLQTVLQGGGGGPRQPFPGGGNGEGHGGERGRRHYINENDGAGQLAAMGMSIAVQELSNLVFQLASNYYTPQFFMIHQRACQKTTRVLIANQGAKVAAALPPVGNIQPQFFQLYDGELIQTRQLLMCF